MNLIFLDIDGVMNHREHYVRSKYHTLQEFCPVAVKNLKQIIKVCDAKIVLSSTWRKFGTTKTLRKLIFSQYGLQQYLIGKTPVLQNEPRGKEIQLYLRRLRKPTANFIIIDDDDDMEEFLPHLVQTSFFDKGLNEAKRDEAIALLRTHVEGEVLT
ncbi:HAD domain-containing protein (plasmid) [Aneurinibacillus sp. Ricciae_BoGa-3]|uniref:HAD domain-containing protein n=1 Tax=Aneurinibacillus sp. Ricciae_BoGa-3 TaxID=3022697 RepID=UPI00233F9287|nr:HAD domain-containing protein [Aneurinibacillus sp. Ricciae_BoGa-3]WCK57067.1 HAD domain-containing protein [Aneurinibacillus sp. Ricciae_BoGa-3]